MTPADRQFVAALVFIAAALAKDPNAPVWLLYVVGMIACAFWFLTTTSRKNKQ